MTEGRKRELAPSDGSSRDVLALATEIVASFSAANRMLPQEVSQLLVEVFTALSGLQSGTTVAEPVPAVAIKKSVTDDFIICLEDGKKLRTLKRYLARQYGLTLEAYKKKWGLPADYPTNAPAYTRLRSGFAKSAGLGRRPRRRT